MTATIWKFDLLVVDEFTIDLPEGATPLSVGMQHGKPKMWCFIPNTAAIRKERTFKFVGTGNPFEGKAMNFIGTIFDYPFVWHVFEEVG